MAVDVGYGQMHSRLRVDPRVEVREGVNARHLDAGGLLGRFELVVGDVSFISLELVLPALDACAPAAEFLLLVKPQFEVGREQVGKGGVVRDDALRSGAADRIARAARALGRQELGRVDSQVPGPKGNREIFLWLSRRADDRVRSRSRAELLTCHSTIQAREPEVHAMIEVTKEASARIRSLLAEDGKLETHGLRMKVVGGGCSGLQYQLSFDDEVREIDHEIEADGVRVIVDEKSALYLVGVHARLRRHAPGIGLQDPEPERVEYLRLRSVLRGLSG